MSKILNTVVLALGLASCLQVCAKSSATVIVNGVTFVDLLQTGMSFNIDSPQVVLMPGQSLDFQYAWSISVKDDGLPNSDMPSDESPAACVSLHVVVCGLPPTGFEQAKAYLFFNYTDLRGSPIPPFAFDVTTRGDAIISLQTSGDSLADSLTRTGEFFLHIQNRSDSLFTGAWPFSTWAAAWEYSSPVPEPSTYALLATGLVALGWRRRSSRMSSL